jgi:hypothetical protein
MIELNLAFYIHTLVAILVLIFIILYRRKVNNFKKVIDSISDLINGNDNNKQSDCFSNCFEIMKHMKEIIDEVPSNLHFYNLKIINEKPHIKYLLSLNNDSCYFDQPLDEEVVKYLGANGIITELSDNNYLIKIMNNNKTFAFFYLDASETLDAASIRYLEFKAKTIRDLVFD